MKQLLGRWVWTVSAGSPRWRRWFASLGLRTQQAWFAGRRASVFLPDGQRLFLTNIEHSYLTFLLHWSGWIAYEPLTLLLVRELIQDKQSYVHVGANIGYFPLVAAADKPSLKVVGFEPNPKVNAIFRDNIRANGSRVICEAKAVSEFNGELDFFLSPSDMSGSLDPQFQKEHAGVTRLPAVSLDEYFKANSFPGPRLLRIIVEGHELSVLRGAAAALGEPGTELIVAVVRDAEPAMLDLLRGHGFAFYAVTDRGLEAADAIRFTRRGDFNFLDWLVTRRAPAAVEEMAGRMRPLIRRIEMKRTSMYRPDWETNRPYA